jgi:adenosylhomocysteinase
VDPAARLAAAHLGFAVPELRDGLSRADVVFTATGRAGAIPFDVLAAHCKGGVFLANLGHAKGELPDAELLRRLLSRPRPHVASCEAGGKEVHLLAEGAMFNLAAGPGDPYDTFDLVTALMLEATGFIATEGAGYPPGLHPLPGEVQDRAAHRYLAGHAGEA